MVLPLDAEDWACPAQLGECCLRVDALRIVPDKQQHLGRSAEAIVRLQQFGRAGDCQDFQVSVAVLLDLASSSSQRRGDCAQARLGRRQRGEQAGRVARLPAAAGASSCR